MKESPNKLNGHKVRSAVVRFPDAVRQQALKDYNDKALWQGKAGHEREAALNQKYKLGRGTLQYWVRKQTGWVQPQSKKKKKHTKTPEKTRAIQVQTKPITPTVVSTISGTREGLLLLRAVQRSLDRKRPSELSEDELTTLLALRNLER
jgi:hypothetical protein